MERVKRGDKPLVWLHIPHDQGLLGWYGFLKKLELLEWTLMEVVQLVCSRGTGMCSRDRVSEKRLIIP